MAKIHGSAVIEALKKAGLADDNTRRVVLDIGVGHVPVVHVEKYADSSMLEAIEAIDAGSVRYAETHTIGDHKVEIRRATQEDAPTEEGWRQFSAADAGAFICDTHGVAMAGTWDEVKLAAAQHVPGLAVLEAGEYVIPIGQLRRS